jgi:hypothetical protein
VLFEPERIYEYLGNGSAICIRTGTKLLGIAMIFKARIERFSRDGYDEINLPDPDADKVSHVIDRMTADWSTCIRIQRDEHVLVICASNGLFAVTVLVGADEFYDLIGDEHAAGWVDFVHGGQQAMHPRRHCVPPECAKEVARGFLSFKGIVPEAPAWERQGESQSV